MVGSRLSVWDAADVLLVVEVADETVIQDLNVKTGLYGQVGHPVYWVVTRRAVYEHTGPISTGYRTWVEYLHGARIPVPYTSVDLATDELVAPRASSTRCGGWPGGRPLYRDGQGVAGPFPHVRQVHGVDAVGNPTGASHVLPFHPGSPGALLRLSGLVQRPDRQPTPSAAAGSGVQPGGRAVA